MVIMVDRQTLMLDNRQTKLHKMAALKMELLCKGMSFATCFLLAILYLPKSSPLIVPLIRGYPYIIGSHIRLRMPF